MHKTENQDHILSLIGTPTYDMSNYVKFPQCVDSSWATGFLLRIAAFLRSCDFQFRWCALARRLSDELNSSSLSCKEVTIFSFRHHVCKMISHPEGSCQKSLISFFGKIRYLLIQVEMWCPNVAIMTSNDDTKRFAHEQVYGYYSYPQVMAWFQTPAC
jgi:hypothetical protein